MNKDDWLTLSPESKAAVLQHRLQLLVDIKKGRHPLSGTTRRGALAALAKEARDTVTNIIDWEQQQYD